MAAFSLDLRQRILHAALRGDATEDALAERFAVSRSFVQKIKRLHRATGSIAPSSARRGPAPTLSPEHRSALASYVATEPDRSGAELAARLASDYAVVVTGRTVNRALAAMQLTLKKRPSAPTSSAGPT